MRVLHLLAAGGIGGIETLIRNYAEYSKNENVYLFAYGGGVIADELRAMKEEVLYAPPGVSGNYEKLKWILKSCKELQVDIVVSHHSSPIFKVALMCIKLCMPHIKVFAYAHANALVICGSKSKGYGIYKIIHRFGFGIADGVVAISNAVKESLVRELRVKRDKIYVLPNAIKLPQTIPDIHIFHDKVELIYVGRLVQEKGVQNIINAISFGDLKSKVYLTIVGDGEYRKDLERLACDLGVDKCVQFVGVQRNIQPYLLNADIFIHFPECEEGFGLTVIEAMAHGLLCICSNNGALPELIMDGKNGYLVQAHSSKALYEKIEWILYNKDKCGSYITIRKNAQDDAQKYNFESYTKNLERLLMK